MTIENALVKGKGQVEDIVDMTDKKSAGDASSVINITNTLTSPFSGVEKNGVANITVGGSNAGCPTNIFGWTGYKF